MTRATWKLHARSSGPYKVQNKIGPNAYVLDIPNDLGINFTFKVEDLVPYHGHSIPDLEPFSPLTSQPMPPLPLVIAHKEEIKAIWEDQIISTRWGDY